MCFVLTFIALFKSTRLYVISLSSTSKLSRVSDAISLANLYLWSRWSTSWQSRHVSLSHVSQNSDNFSCGWMWHMSVFSSLVDDWLSVRASSFVFIVWSFVIFKRWWAWTQLSHIYSAHSTHQDVATASSVQLLHLIAWNFNVNHQWDCLPEIYWFFCATKSRCFIHTFASTSDAWDSSMFASDNSIRNWSRMTQSCLLGVLHFCNKISQRNVLFSHENFIFNESKWKLPDTARWPVGCDQFHWIWTLYKRCMRHVSIPKALAHPLHPKPDDKTYTFCIDFRHSQSIYRHHSVNTKKENVINKSIGTDKTVR